MIKIPSPRRLRSRTTTPAAALLEAIEDMTLPARTTRRYLDKLGAYVLLRSSCILSDNELRACVSAYRKHKRAQRRREAAA